jgi:hypothetical protein
MLCLPVFNSSGQIIGYDCRPFPYPVEIDPCPGCPDWAISLEHLVLPEDPYYVEGLNGGLGLLAEAAIAEPREAAALRAAAQEEFLAAAGRLGDTRTWLGVVGTVDWEGNRINPDPQPWLEAAGVDLADGLNLMRQAITEPDPQPWLDAAMDEFEEAYLEIAQQEALGR